MFLSTSFSGMRCLDEQLRVDAHDQDLFVVRAIEDADAAAFRQVLEGPPEKVVVEVLGAGLLERRHLAALGVDARHDVLDGAVFAGGVQRLKNQQ